MGNETYDKDLDRNISEACGVFVKAFQRLTGLDVKGWRVDKLLPSAESEKRDREICLTIKY